MIKGTLLGISISVFIVSLFLAVTSLTGTLKENIITGAAVGQSAITTYSFVALFLSFIVGFFVIILIFKKK